MRILALDIELTPMVTYSWSLWPNSIPIQQIVSTQRMLCWGARWYGEKTVRFRSEHHDGRKVMLDEIHELLTEADAVLSWNGRNFDSKHLRRELLQAGYPPPSPWREIDLMQASKSQFKFASNKLDHVSRELGFAGKTAHTGFQLWLDCMDGKEAAWRLMRRYQKQDVDLLIDIYERFKGWLPNHPNMTVTMGEEAKACPVCKGPSFQARGYAFTNAGKYQRYQCTNDGCGKWFKGSRRIGSTSEMRPA